MSFVVTAEMIERYVNDGVVCLRGVLEPKWIDVIERGLRDVEQAPGPMSYSERDSANRMHYLSDMFSAVSNPWLRQFIFDGPIAATVGALLRATRINFFYDHSFLRRAGSSHVTEWHNDKAYWPVSGEQLCTVWVPVQAVTLRNGPLEYVIGSHKWERAFKDSFYPMYRQLDFRGLDPENAIVDEPPDVNAYRHAFNIATFELDPGDCLVHHPLTLHASPKIDHDARRWAYATRWAGDDVRFAPRVDTQRLVYDPGLNAGDPLDSELFPRVWPAPSH